MALNPNEPLPYCPPWENVAFKNLLGLNKFRQPFPRLSCFSTAPLLSVLTKVVQEAAVVDERESCLGRSVFSVLSSLESSELLMWGSGVASRSIRSTATDLQR